MRSAALYACVAVILGTAIHACASGGLIPAGRTAYGVYKFTEQVVDARPAILLEGSVTLLPDTLVVTLASSPCAWDARSHGMRWIRYVCGDARFTFDRQNPLRESSWSASGTVMVSRRECTQTVVDDKGVERCVRQATDRVARTRQFGGRLRLRRG